MDISAMTREVLDFVTELDRDLPGIKTRLNPLGNTSNDEIWKNFVLLYPRVAKTVRAAENMGNRALDWNLLDSWLKDTRKAITQHVQIIQAALKLDCSLGSSGFESGNADTCQLISKNEAQFKLGSAAYGPNWLSHIEQIGKMTGLDLSGLEPKIPLQTIQPKIMNIARKIMGSWNTLKRHQGKIKCFKQDWARMQPQARRTWLQQFSQILPCPDFAIHQLAQHSTTGIVAKEAFLAPLLNMEDLSQADILPDLLEIRSITHPKLLLLTDSRLVPIGYWYGKLPRLLVAGRISFSMDQERQDSDYGIDFTFNSLENPLLDNPSIGFYRLMAQERIYDFLVSCLSSQLPRTLSDCSVNVADWDTSFSLLSRSARLEYGSPDHSDWPYLQSVLSTSVDEALDDLWQLRSNADLWLMRMKEMRGDTSKMLHSVFSRIDTFQALKCRLDACQNCRWSGSSISNDDINSFEDVASMYFTLQSVVNEQLASMQSMMWSPKETTNKPFCFLFSMMEKDDPALRVMGLSTVLKIIEQQIPEVSSCDPIPFTVRQTFNDMSVVAICMQETSKHFSTARKFSHKYACIANQTEARWQGRDCPWIRLIQNTLGKLSLKVYKLNNLVSDKNSLEERHHSFWATIDNEMKGNKEFSSIVDMILHHAPIPIRLTSKSDASFVEWNTQDTASEAPYVQARKSKGKTMPQTSISSPGLSNPTPTIEPRNLPTVYIKTQSDKDFWNNLCHDRGQETFDDWSKFLTNVGYAKIPQGGSGYRFELNDSRAAIVFHDLHGHNGKKISRRQARSWWARRLEKNFRIVLCDERPTSDETLLE